MESNLPPGVATSDLPGNSSKDATWGRLWMDWTNEFSHLANQLIDVAIDWEKECQEYTVEKKKLEKLLGELDKVISEMDRCAELIPCEEDLAPEEPEHDPSP